MKRASADARIFSGSRRRPRAAVALAGLGAIALVLAACGGGDDDAADPESSTTTLSPTVSIATTTTPAPTTTLAPPPTTTLPPLDLVTEGASVVVANASGIDGAAGRMTDALGAVGFSTGTATNSSEGQINTSKIYYDPENAEARAVADSLREALGGGDIEVLELTVPAPTDTGEIGDASILLAMGNDTADKTLDELQGRVPPSDESTEEGSPDDSAPDDSAPDDSAPDESTSEDSGDA